MQKTFIPDDEDELSHIEGLPASYDMVFDAEEWDGVERVRQLGWRLAAARSADFEGASMADIGDDCWICSVQGGQFLHSDRHSTESGGHVWNAVISADGDQMLLVKETPYNYRHHRLVEGALIYFNTYQAHMVSRADSGDRCVIVQVGGIGPDEPDRALDAMRRAIARISDAGLNVRWAA